MDVRAGDGSYFAGVGSELLDLLGYLLLDLGRDGESGVLEFDLGW